MTVTLPFCAPQISQNETFIVLGYTDDYHCVFRYDGFFEWYGLIAFRERWCQQYTNNDRIFLAYGVRDALCIQRYPERFQIDMHDLIFHALFWLIRFDSTGRIGPQSFVTETVAFDNVHGLFECRTTIDNRVLSRLVIQI